jgi:hypothetical protein
MFLGVALGATLPGAAQTVTGADMPGYTQTLGVNPKQPNASYSAQLAESSIPGNILWPGEQPTFTIQIVNNTAQPLQAKGKVDVIAYGTKGRPGDIWIPQMFKIADVGSVPVAVEIAANGFHDLTIAPKIPARLGAYALVVDLGAQGRQFVTSFVRTFAATTQRLQYPKFCLDELPLPVLKRLGVQAIRYGVGYKPTTDPDFPQWFQEQRAKLQAFRDANIAVLFMVGGGEFFVPMQPLGRPRPWLDAQDTMRDTKFDLAWLPSYDADFQKWCRLFAGQLGWPKGPINAFSLWNEPWEGISISGWGADMLRYREIFTAMAEGVELARHEDGADVLLGGCDSTSNAMDKLFGDGKDTFLKWFDFVSIHYQGLAPNSTVKMWVNRKAPHGRVRIWDTESWVANTDDRVAAVVAGDRAAGYDRAMGIYGGNIAEEHEGEIRSADGSSHRVRTVNAWSVAASVGASQHFIGEREFKTLLFKQGLPWIMVFHGRRNGQGVEDPDDGTVVVVGDLGEEFGSDTMLFRTARGLKELAHKEAVRHQLAALRPDAPAREREALETALDTDEVLSGATMTLASRPGIHLYNFYGNPVPPQNGKIVVPLDGRGFFLRSDSAKGSFDRLLDAIHHAYVAGIEPLATIAHDLTAPIAQRPVLRLSLTNILNRPVQGTLKVTLGRLTLQAPTFLRIAANTTQELELPVIGGTPAPNNTYPLTLLFDAGRDGKTIHHEELHVNTIARRTITVDGNLDDWKGVLPQTIVGAGHPSRSLTEAAWFPFKPFDPSVKRGFATGYLAYDANYFYFAAKIADDTPEEGMVRFETRNDDDYFYPEKSYVERLKNPQIAPVTDHDTDTPQALLWPEGVRRYTYRKDPELPSGNAPNHDNVQIAFNVLPPDEKPWYLCPPGTMPGFTTYKDTDYEYALNSVAPKYGGGVEIWRLEVPGMPHKHFYPRQPKSPYDGPVRDGKLAIRREGNTRIVECALPWTEIPEVKRRMEAGQTIKFSFRVNDNADVGCMELSRRRSVAKRNGSFHVDWVEHWANELEFGFEQPPVLKRRSEMRSLPARADLTPGPTPCRSFLTRRGENPHRGVASQRGD